MTKQERVAVVTGAASGIGRKISEEFLKEGYKVVFSDFNKENLDKVISENKEKGFECHGVVCDVSKEEDVKNMIDEAVKQYGRLDILVNNAGLQYVSLIENFPTDKFEKMLQIMITGAFTAIKYAFPVMKAQKYGRIINIGSINGVIGFAGKSAYNSAKHAILGLTKVAALEAADSGVTVNAMCPGYVDTPLVRGQFADLAKTRGITEEEVLEAVLYPFIPQKRLIDVQEIADYVVFLTSEKAKGVTGQACLLDAGYTCQ